MFTLETTPIAKAVENARKLHPTVRVLAFGEYSVTGSKGNTYTVKCYRDERGQKVVDCNCATRDDVACKHGMAAVALHLWVAASFAAIATSARRTIRRRV